jgi:hypothetical protein
MDREAYNEPGDVTAYEGQVVVQGPGNLAIALTPDAALKLSDRLFMAASEVRGQRFMTSLAKARAGYD